MPDRNAVTREMRDFARRAADAGAGAAYTISLEAARGKSLPMEAVQFYTRTNTAALVAQQGGTMSRVENVREQLGVVVQLRALLGQFDGEIAIVRDALEIQVNAAALIADGSQAQQTRNAAAAAVRALATMQDARQLLDEYRAMMIAEGNA